MSIRVESHFVPFARTDNQKTFVLPNNASLACPDCAFQQLRSSQSTAGLDKANHGRPLFPRWPTAPERFKSRFPRKDCRCFCPAHTHNRPAGGSTVATLHSEPVWTPLFVNRGTFAYACNCWSPLGTHHPLLSFGWLLQICLMFIHLFLP